MTTRAPEDSSRRGNYGLAFDSAPFTGRSDPRARSFLRRLVVFSPEKDGRFHLATCRAHLRRGPPVDTQGQILNNVACGSAWAVAVRWAEPAPGSGFSK